MRKMPPLSSGKRGNQTIARAMSVARKVSGARGGGLASSDGRSDDIIMTVPAGAHVIPADIVAALGRGDGAAGEAVLRELFPGSPDSDTNDPQVAIAASGGEYIIPPGVVALVGEGDKDAGHNALNKFIEEVREANIKLLKELKINEAKNG